MSLCTNALGTNNADKAEIAWPEQQDISNIAEKVQTTDNIDDSPFNLEKGL